MEVHLGDEDRLGELGEAPHGGQVGGARGAEREQPRVLDQEQVVLAYVAREALDGQRAVAHAAHERVLVLGLPDRVGGAAQLG